jgi:hypothetical protein
MFAISLLQATAAGKVGLGRLAGRVRIVVAYSARNRTMFNYMPSVVRVSKPLIVEKSVPYNFLTVFC